MMENEIILEHLSIMVTTYCNLNCRDCADMIPKRRRRMYDLILLKKDIQKILLSVEKIEECLIIGGEAVLYPNLAEVIDYCAQQEKIKKIVITTNALCEPNVEVMNKIKQRHVIMRISGYPAYVTPNRDKIVADYKNAGIEVEDLKDMRWMDTGEKYDRGRSENDLKKVFASCMMRRCMGIMPEGIITLCSHEMEAYEAGGEAMPCKGEYIDVRNTENLKNDFIRLCEREYISTCNWCDGISCATKRYVDTATQILPKNYFLEYIASYLAFSDCQTVEQQVAFTRAFCEILQESERYLQGVREYSELIAIIEKWSENDKNEEIRSQYFQGIANLIGSVAKDYNYEVPINMAYGLCKNTDQMANVIKVDKAENESADIVISDDEIYEALSRSYPIDEVMYNRLFIAAKLIKVRKEKVQQIVCGLSYTQYGIIESSFSAKTSNLSVTGEDIINEILLAKNAIEMSDSIRRVILVATYYQGFYDMANDTADIHMKIMKEINQKLIDSEQSISELISNDKYIVNEANRGILSLYSQICDVNRMLETRNKLIAENISEKDYFNEKHSPCKWGGLKYDFHTLDSTEKVAKARKTAELNERVCCLSGYGRTRDAIVDFLNEMKLKKITVVIVVPPMTKYLYESYIPELRDMYYELLVPIYKRYENVIFADLAQNSTFDENDFIDFEHLNTTTGAHKMSILLNKICEND